ncbi:YecA family protein [Bacillus piscicola]|uniref:YecA family protein n=1 Tax=Bacillus piscicola TaxID=1632684 RepID=UPI001F09B8E9|nr:SEC-C metal-binding domain-containing protein [Bacillus piscicola]
MSGRMNEEDMNLLLEELKDMRKKQEEKRYKKYWREIRMPLTLHEGLSRYTKDELSVIRKGLHIKNASSLKKAELIAVLEESIPPMLEHICQYWDDERFNFLMKIAGKEGKLAIPEQSVDDEQLDYFRSTGLIYSGMNEGKMVLAVPEDLIEPIRALKNNLTVRAAINRNTEWIKLTGGLLYYYGTLSLTQLEDMLEAYTKRTVDVREYISVMYQANDYREQIQIDGGSFSDLQVVDPDRVKREHKMREETPYYPFTKQQLLKAGVPGFVDRNESYVQFVRFLSQNFTITKEEVGHIAEEVVHATKIGHSPNDVIRYLGETLEFNDMQSVQALMEKLMQLMNNTREWFLKGHTSSELHEYEKKHLQPLPDSKNNQATSPAKVGRNEPCPCGSGKKYKKCCGR